MMLGRMLYPQSALFLTSHSASFNNIANYMVTILFSGQKVCARFYQAWINYDRNMVKY